MGAPRAARLLQAASLLLVCVAVAPSLAGRPGDKDTGFGRWESLLNRCKLHWPVTGAGNGATSSGCLKLRLDQSIEGMLRVRFINAAGGHRFASEELTFVGLLLKQDQPMRCRGGACDPIWPVRLMVHGVASRRFDGRGLAQQLPSNQLAKGSCELGPIQLSCQASGQNGQTWQASATLPGAAQTGQSVHQLSPKRL